MIYILDAYNVIHKIPSLAAALDKDLRSAREALVRLAEQLVSSRGDISKMILVFDGKSQFRDLPQENFPKIQLVFSDTGEAADERIVEVLEDLGNKARVCVVSDDNFVRNQARAYKTNALSVADFYQITRSGTRAAQGKPRLSAGKQAPSKNSSLSSKHADEITQAYKKHLGL